MDSLATIFQEVLDDMVGSEYTTQFNYDRLRAAAIDQAYSYCVGLHSGRAGVFFKVRKDSEWYFLRESVSNPAKMTTGGFPFPGWLSQVGDNYPGIKDAVQEQTIEQVVEFKKIDDTVLDHQLSEVQVTIDDLEEKVQVISAHSPDVAGKIKESYLQHAFNLQQKLVSQKQSVSQAS